MINLGKIKFSTEVKQIQEEQGNFYGCSWMQTNWGPIKQLVSVRDNKELDLLFGTYDDSNENAWFQMYNFLLYSRNLKVFRCGSETAIPTFDGGNDLTAVNGSSNSHLFVSDENTDTIDTWNSTDNGSDLYIRLNDLGEEENLPTFASTQILFVAARYTGTEGNNIGISIANYLDDLSTRTIFKSSDDVESNPYFYEFFRRPLGLNEYAIAITFNDVIVATEILSTDPLSNNYIENWDNNYVVLRLDTNHTISVSTDSDSTKRDNTIFSIQNEKLLFGSSDIIGDTYIVDQLDMLKDVYRYDFDVVFSETTVDLIRDKLEEICQARGETISIINNSDYTEVGYLQMNDGNFILLNTGGRLII